VRVGVISVTFPATSDRASAGGSKTIPWPGRAGGPISPFMKWGATGRLKLSASFAILSHSVNPPTRGTSAWTTSTAPARM
jgi:hypothetical protein